MDINSEINICFINHCEDENGNPACDLGIASFDCPVCKNSIEDYDEVWWNLNPNAAEPLDAATYSCKKCDQIYKIFHKNDSFYVNTKSL